mmetsp:Transcript_46493/g.80817  ORF Transcript_46493/g.80817 Transcript_46493/m.80817 type:complete len:204 (+) Transcript_46493:314-925(+)
MESDCLPPLPLPLPFRPSSFLKALAETWLDTTFGATPSSAKSSAWNLGPSLCFSSSAFVPDDGPIMVFCHSLRSSSAERWPLRGALRGSKSTQSGAPSPSSFFFTPSLFQRRRFSCTSFDCFQDSTSFGTWPPRSCTVPSVSRMCPFDTLSGDLADETKRSFVPGHVSTLMQLVCAYSIPFNFCSPSDISKASSRHLPPSNSS